MNCTPDYAFDKLRRLTQERKRGTGGEFRGDQPCDAPQPGDRCGRYCCIEVCTCPTPKGTLKKPPLDPNCPDCCDDLENCAQAGGPGITADDCIGGNKGCVVLGSEYFQKCELKKGRGAERITGDGGSRLVKYNLGKPGGTVCFRAMLIDEYQDCFDRCMQAYNSEGYCSQLCSGMKRPPPLQPRRRRTVRREGMVTYINCSDVEIGNFKNMLHAMCTSIECCVAFMVIGETEEKWAKAKQCIEDICAGRSQMCIDCSISLLCKIGYMYTDSNGCVHTCGHIETSIESLRALLHELVHTCFPYAVETPWDFAREVAAHCFGAPF